MKEWNQKYLSWKLKAGNAKTDFYDAKIKKQRKIQKGDLGDTKSFSHL